MHEKDMRSARNIWMASDREDTDLARIRIVGKLAVEVIEVIPPNILDISRVHPAVAVGTVFDEHHRWKIIDIPASRVSTRPVSLPLIKGFIQVSAFCV